MSSPQAAPQLTDYRGLDFLRPGLEMVRAQVCFAALFAVRCVGEPEPLATLISRALEAHQRGDAAQAATLYDAVLVRETELTPTVAAQLLGNAGALALVRGERATALRVFSRAVETTPDSAEARVNLAIALNQFGEHDEALSHAQKAVALAPLYAKAHQALAACYQDVGSERAAQRHWSIAEVLASEGEADVSTRPSPTACDARDPDTCITDPLAEIVDVIGAASTPRVLSAEPAVIDLGDDFASPALCAALIEAARKHLRPSHVSGGSDLDDAKGRSLREGSFTAWLDASESPAVGTLQAAAARLLSISSSQLVMRSEPLQVVQYRGAGAEFATHVDSTAFQKRQITILIYLSNSTADAGGETWFPLSGSDWKCGAKNSGSARACVEEARAHASQSESGLKVSPRQGRAILFLSHQPASSVALAVSALGNASGAATSTAPLPSARVAPHTLVDPKSIHASLPLSGGEKWVANLWVSL